MKSLNPNSMIQGRYLIVQPIGKGGMGEVYLAVDQRLGSAVALKRTFFSEDSTLGNAFEREARILARLRHPVLPKVIDHFAENGDQFLVMEHISGDDIAKRLEVADKPFPVSWVMFWSDQMLDALTYLHSHEPPIVHRDIKPQNLKLTDDNHIVLLDFGLSKDFDSTASGLNSASVAGYSPHFASMEQIRGTGTDARSDLYSLAATLYQMLTNVVPPDALTRADSMLGGKGDPIRPMQELNPEVAPAISDVLIKAIAIRQDERYSTAAEMQKDLRRAFNKGKSEAEITPEAAFRDGEPPIVAKRPEPEIEAHKTMPVTPDSPELETRIRIEPTPQLDATLHLGKPDVAVSTAQDVKPSEQKTAVFTIPNETPGNGSADLAEAQAEAPATMAAAAPASRPATAVQPQKSKTGLIAGVLVSLILLAIVGGGAVWYLMKQPASTGASAPTPPPANASTPLPVLAADSNQSTNQSTNSNTFAEIPTDTNSSAGNTPTAVKTTNTATAKAPTTPKTTQAPTAKAPPKSKKDDSSVILQ